jgi:beta-lactam-binding protein with PASTA domain/predicted Ser/Thr protein kinase
MDTTLARVPIGQLLDGRYRVESHLAHGGMATVYLGTDTRLDRMVALKIMHAEFASDEDFVRRFVTEARSVARLSHPNVVTVYDQGADGRTLFLAMEYVPGQTLRDLLTERGQLRPREALDIIEGVLSGLGAAHRAGIAHRDVKPENVLLGHENMVKVADFGLARLMSGTSYTKSGMLIGTAAYLAPEQVTGSGADLRTDVYAAGVMLFEMLTGKQPHTGDTPLAVAYKHVSEPVPAPSSVVPGLPPALDALVALATSRDPGLRPADAGQFLHAITGARSGLPLGGPAADPLPAPVVDPAFAETAAPYPAPLGDWPQPPAAAPGIPGRHAAPLGDWPPDPASAGTVSPGTVSPGTVSPGTATPGGGGPAGATYGSAPAWPNTLADRGALDIVPGMAPPPAQQSPGVPRDGTGAMATERFGAGPGRPAANQTLIVTGGDIPYGSVPPAAYPAAREPRLQRLLFSRRLGYLVLALAAVAVFAVLGWYLMAGRYTIVPKVAGMPAAAAQDQLRNTGFTTATGKAEFDNNVAKGVVIRTIPPGRSRLTRGSRVTLIVSAGPHMIAMPQVTGQSVTTAQAMIRHAGLVPGKIKLIVSTTIGPGIVIATHPDAGASWPQPEPVTLTVSAGPPLPDFVGQQKAVAEQWAAANGVALNEVTAKSSDQPVGTVIKQSVKAGSAFTRGQVITIEISPGPPMVTIPDVDGFPVGKAIRTLQALGFLVTVDTVGPFHTVIAFAPMGQALKGSTITLTVGLPHFGG